MKINETEEIRYCTSCGAANKKSAILCSSCEKKMIVKHRHFATFLLKRIKGDVFDKGQETLFELIKKFLFNHLYGVVLTVSIVSTGVTVLSNPAPYIKNVTELPTISNPVLDDETTSSDFVLTEDEQTRINYVISTYDAIIDTMLRPQSTYWEETTEYGHASSFWAENNIEGYAYSGIHDMVNNPINVGAMMSESYSGEPEDEPNEVRDWIESSIVTGSDVKSELGQKLYADGYDVLEIDYYLVTFKGHIDGYDFMAPLPEDAEYYEKVKYVILLTRKSGESDWYVAEDRLAERFGV